MVGEPGIEPGFPKDTDLQSARHTTLSNSPIFGKLDGIRTRNHQVEGLAAQPLAFQFKIWCNGQESNLLSPGFNRMLYHVSYRYEFGCKGGIRTRINRINSTAHYPCLTPCIKCFWKVCQGRVHPPDSLKCESPLLALVCLGRLG